MYEINSYQIIIIEVYKIKIERIRSQFKKDA